MKFDSTHIKSVVIIVAPFAGAWIEILNIIFSDQAYRVAPFAGAWIEIELVCNTSQFRRASLPSRERGLKFATPIETPLSSAVAPFAGAWIEMHMLPDFLQSILSLPSRERGLKLILRLHGKIGTKSLPSRERGLKSADPVQLRLPFCRSLRGSVD